jgi:hypothetical protein
MPEENREQLERLPLWRDAAATEPLGFDARLLIVVTGGFSRFRI